MDTKFKAKGEMIFLYTNKELCIKTREFEKDWEKFFGEKNIYHLMDGKEFLEAVENGCFIDYDGSIANIFVNGYDSNLGLHYKGISQGGFLVDKETFLEICNDYDVKVNWANK